MLTSEGYEIYPQELEAARQYVFFIDFTRCEINSWESWTRKIFSHLGYPDADQNIISKYISFMQIYNNGFKLFGEVIEVVESLFRMNLKLSIVTTIPEFRFSYLIEPIRKYLDNIVTGSNAKCAKGNPKMYHFDLKCKGVNPNQNLFVGDDLYYDIEIPKNLGQNTVHINREKLQVRSKFADFEIQSLNELIEIVAKFQ